MGELMISSNAGTIFPDALTDTSSFPSSTVEKLSSSFLTLLFKRENSMQVKVITIHPDSEYLITLFFRFCRFTSVGISLSIYVLFW